MHLTRVQHAGDPILTLCSTTKAVHQKLEGFARSCSKPGEGNNVGLLAGFGLSSVSWLVFAITFSFDLSRYSLESTWLWRFPLVLIAAGQVAQLR